MIELSLISGRIVLILSIFEKNILMKRINNVRLVVLSALIFGLAFLNIFFKDIPNFSPIAAIALFSGTFFSNKKLAFLIPIAAIFISDLFVGLHSLMWAVYLSFALVVVLGTTIKRVAPLKVVGLSLLGSCLFFVITNFAVWAQGSFYPSSFGGLMECYYMGLPFFKNTLIGDLSFNVVLFTAFSFAEHRIPALRLVSSN